MELDFLPDEIFSDILLRLPIKSLIRCTAVCRPWKSKIKCSNFIYTHLNCRIKANNEQGTHLLLHHGFHDKNLSDRNKKEEVYSLHYDNHAFEEYCKIDFQIDSLVSAAGTDSFCVADICNGVICFAQDVWSKYHNYILCNRSIRKAVMLPDPHVTFCSHIPFDDTIGFGFDALTSDYKVVRLVTLDFGRQPTLDEVYLVATGSWKSLGSIAYCSDISAQITYVFFNGAIHWAVRRWDDRCSVILTFDVGSEAFGEIMMPESIRSDRFLWKSKVSVTGDGKSLALFTICKKHREADYFLDMWVMKEYGMQESWAKLMTLGPQGGLPMPLSFRKSSQVLVLQEEYSYGKIVLASFDLTSGMIDKVVWGSHLKSSDNGCSDSNPNNSDVGDISIPESFPTEYSYIVLSYEEVVLCYQNWRDSHESYQNKLYSYSVHPYEESLVLLDVGNAVSY